MAVSGSQDTSAPPLLPRTVSAADVQYGIVVAAEWARHVAGVS